MAWNQGDINMAKQLQAEFGNSKPAKQRGRGAGSGKRGGSYQGSSGNHYQYEEQQQANNYATLDRRGGSGRGGRYGDGYETSSEDQYQDPQGLQRTKYTTFDRRGGGGGGGQLGHHQASSEFQYWDQPELQPSRQNDFVGFARGGGQYKGQGLGQGGSDRPATVRSPSVQARRPAWHGPLVTNDSPGKNSSVWFTPEPKRSLKRTSEDGRLSPYYFDAEADQFFHQPKRSLQAVQGPFSQAAAPSISPFQQPSGQQTGSLKVAGGFTFGQSFAETTTKTTSPPEPLNTSAQRFAVTTQQQELHRDKQEEEGEDVEMGGVNSPPTIASNPVQGLVATRPGLAASRWNPENLNCYSETNEAKTRQEPFRPTMDSSSSAKPKIVRSGILQGHGLEVSR